MKITLLESITISNYYSFIFKRRIGELKEESVFKLTMVSTLKEYGNIGYTKTKQLSC